MTKRMTGLLAAMLAALALAAPVKIRAAERREKAIQVFVLSGQSNMVGQGDSALLPKDLLAEPDRTLMFEDGKWQPLKPTRRVPERHREERGMGEYTFGPEMAFAHEMAAAWPDRRIGIVKVAVDATGILAWHPDWSKERAGRDAPKGSLFKATLEKVRAACAAEPCELKAWLWLQGEANMKTEADAKAYMGNFSAVVTAMRNALAMPDLLLLVASYRNNGLPDDLSDLPPDADLEARGQRPYARLVLQAHYDAQKRLAPAKMVAMHDLPTHPNNGHFNTEGQLQLGRLFAEAYLNAAAPSGKPAAARPASSEEARKGKKPK